MEFKNTVEVLHAQAREIAEITLRLEQQDDIPFIEIDILMDKLRNLYDLSADLRLALQTDYKQERKDSEIKKEEPFAAQEKTEPKPEEKPAQPMKEVIREKIAEDLATEAIEKGKQKDTTRLVSDRFKESSPTVNEENSGKSKKEDVTTQYKTSPIGSIKSALGLNEKFELINQLFKGNKEQFDHTIEVLDAAGSFVEAYNYLEESFEWDMNDTYVQRLLELIRRKLIKRRNEQ